MQPLVSVSCITYNQVLYIRDALEGFLMQKTTFPIEILVYDDASNDGTVQILREYQAKYPGLIFPYFQEENQYSKGVRAIGHRFNLPRARGKYIATCEGDDYWTDPTKLQKQVDFLEAHPDYVMCFHNTMFVFEDGSSSYLMHEKPWDTCSLEELIVNFNDVSFPNRVTAGHTSSMVFRKGFLNDLPAWYSQSLSGDLPYQILLAQYGKAKFLNEVMSVYRKHPGGVSSGPGFIGIKLCENRITMYEDLKRTLDKKYAPVLDQVLMRYYVKEGDLYCKQLKVRKAFYDYRRTSGRGIAFKMVLRYLTAHFYSLDFMIQLRRKLHPIYHRIWHLWHGMQRSKLSE